MRHIIALLVIVLFSSFLVSCGEKQSATTQPDLQHIYVTATNDNGFIPDKVIMKRGVILDIYSYDQELSLKNDALKLDEVVPVKEVKSIRVLPDAAGDYRLSCVSCAAGKNEILVTIN